MNTRTIAWCATVWLATVLPVHAEQVTVETTECYGGGGFSSFDERRLFKIQQGDCDHPDRPGEKLYQILLKSNSNMTRYEVLWVTKDEARSVMAQTRENRDYRRDRYDHRETVIIREQVQTVPVPQLRPGPIPPLPLPPATEAETSRGR